jgi:hypothetical protein
MIMGMDLMTSIGITVDCEQRFIRWGGKEIPLKIRATLNNDEILHMLYHAANEPDILQEAEKRQNRILDDDYRKVEVDPFVQELKHLTMDEKQILSKTLRKFPTLFGGGLGMLNIKPVRLELIDGATPYHARPFPVPQSLEAMTKTEMKRLTDIDVFNESSDSEWAAPTFIQAKKTRDVRILTYFRRLNAQIKIKPFPLPKISDLLKKLSGFKYATAVDLSMGYYHIPLDLGAHKLCTTIFPWGKYQYKRLPMGVKTSPDIFQRIMYELLGDIPNIQVYVDDIIITSNVAFEEHAAIIEQVLDILQKASFRANLRKCYFGEAKIDCLGYEITRDGIQPQPKKVEAILKLSPPKTKRQLRNFLGKINYYRDMWQKRSHMLAPLTGLVSPPVKYKW